MAFGGYVAGQGLRLRAGAALLAAKQKTTSALQHASGA